MFDFSFAEIALMVVVAVIFIGPKELPVVIKAVAKAVRWVRALVKELRAVFDEIMKESGLDEAAKDMDHEVRMIRGDDGKMYESYDHPVMTSLPKATPTGSDSGHEH